MGKIARVNLAELLTLVDRMAARGVKYGYGSKAPSLDCDSSKIHEIDCSGLSRYGLAKSTDQQLIVEEGSQPQREQFEKLAAGGQVRKLARWSDVQYIDPSRLVIGFTRPGYNGCGVVGHVFFGVNRGGRVVTLESYGGHGVGSRPWDTPVLLREAYNAFELPTEGHPF